MECKGGVGGCGKVKCFRNKSPSYSLSLREDKTLEAKLENL